MSAQFCSLCTVLVKETFGEIISLVASSLLKWGPQTLRFLASGTKLPVKKIRDALATLIQHNLVTFDAEKGKSVVYQIHSERVLLLLRYPKYLVAVKNAYGDGAEMLLEELQRKGQDSCSNLLFQAAKRMNETLEGTNNMSVVTLRDTLKALIENKFIQRCPLLVPSSGEAVVQIKEQNLYVMPELIIKSINERVQSKASELGVQPDSENMWRMNYDRFHQEFRDQILVSAVTKRIDANAGELIKILLQLMYVRTDAWASSSNPIPLSEIKDTVKRAGTHPLLSQYLDQYLKLLDEDSTQFIQKVGDAGGGQYSVNVKSAFTQLAWMTVESIVLERFGSKAARIFRLVKTKRYVEQEQMQEVGMIPAKEAKLHTYNLLEENFLQLKELRKSLNNTGPNKSIFLFHIDFNMVIRMVLETCYKALFNSLLRHEHEKTENKWLIEKQQRIDSLHLSLQEQNASETQLAEVEAMLTPPERTVLEKVQTMTKKLGQAEFKLDETIFLIQMYLYYQLQKT